MASYANKVKNTNYNNRNNQYYNNYKPKSTKLMKKQKKNDYFTQKNDIDHNKINKFVAKLFSNKTKELLTFEDILTFKIIKKKPSIQYKIPRYNYGLDWMISPQKSVDRLCEIIPSFYYMMPWIAQHKISGRNSNQIILTLSFRNNEEDMYESGVTSFEGLIILALHCENELEKALGQNFYMHRTQRLWNGGNHKYVVSNVFAVPKYLKSLDPKDDDASKDIIKALKKEYRLANFTFQRLGKTTQGKPPPPKVLITSSKPINLKHAKKNFRRLHCQHIEWSNFLQKNNNEEEKKEEDQETKNKIELKAYRKEKLFIGNANKISCKTDEIKIEQVESEEVDPGIEIIKDDYTINGLNHNIYLNYWSNSLTEPIAKHIMDSNFKKRAINGGKWAELNKKNEKKPFAVFAHKLLGDIAIARSDYIEEEFEDDELEIIDDALNNSNNNIDDNGKSINIVNVVSPTIENNKNNKTMNNNNDELQSSGKENGSDTEHDKNITTQLKTPTTLLNNNNNDKNINKNLKDALDDINDVTDEESNSLEDDGLGDDNMENDIENQTPQSTPNINKKKQQQTSSSKKSGFGWFYNNE